MRTRSCLISVILSLLILFGLVNNTRAAEEYPVKPILCVVSAEAVSDLDILARPFLQKASSRLGKPIIIVNKPGAGMTIGYREIHDAKPDGYTIGVATAYYRMIITNLPFWAHTIYFRIRSLPLPKVSRLLKR